MTFSIFVFDHVNVQDIVVDMNFVTIVLTFTREVRDDLLVEKLTIDLVDNHSPPDWVETLGISIGEEVNTREALS